MALNIFQRINAVREVIGYVQKDKSVSTGGGSYRAVSHDQVTGMVRAALIKHGVIILPPSVISATFHQKEEGSKQRLYDATYKVEFVNMDSPEDRFAVEINAHALDNGDKAPGKAMSYATKYAILKLFNIETGEDEESRYQQDEFDAKPYLDSLESCKSREQMVPVYQEAKKAAFAAGDKAAIKAIDDVAKSMGAKFKAASESIAGQA